MKLIVRERDQSTSLSHPLFFGKVSGMEGASPLKNGFFNSEFSVRSGVSSAPDFYDQKRLEKVPVQTFEHFPCLIGWTYIVCFYGL